MNTGYQYNAPVSHKVNSYPGMGEQQADRHRYRELLIT